MTVIIPFNIFIMFFIIFQCHPVSAFWERAVNVADQGACVSTTLNVKITYAHAAVIMVADWSLAILPITIVWNLPMSRKTKLYIEFVLGLGSMCVFSPLLPAIIYLEKLLII
jgi:hypothetical protein